MITLEEFLKRWPARVDQTTKDEIQLFIDTVLERSDDYDAFVNRMRASGKFKSVFGDFGANAHPTNMTNNYMTILSSKEKADAIRLFFYANRLFFWLVRFGHYCWIDSRTSSSK